MGIPLKQRYPILISLFLNDHHAVKDGKMRSAFNLCVCVCVFEDFSSVNLKADPWLWFFGLSFASFLCSHKWENIPGDTVGVPLLTCQRCVGVWRPCAHVCVNVCVRCACKQAGEGFQGCQRRPRVQKSAETWRVEAW